MNNVIQFPNCKPSVEPKGIVALTFDEHGIPKINHSNMSAMELVWLLGFFNAYVTNKIWKL